MKTSTKLIVVGTLLGTLGFAGAARLVHAAQPQTPIAIMPEHHSGDRIAQASNGEGETSESVALKRSINLSAVILKYLVENPLLWCW